MVQALIVYLDDHLAMAVSRFEISSMLRRMLDIMKLLNVPVKVGKTIEAATEIMFLGYWWMPRIDLVTLDPGRWSRVESQLCILIDMLMSNSANAQDVRCVTSV